MVGMRERIAIMTMVEMATRFGGRLRLRDRDRVRRRVLTGGEEGDINRSVLTLSAVDISWTWLTNY